LDGNHKEHGNHKEPSTAKPQPKLGKAGFTAETLVVRKNRNLRFRVVPVGRQFFH
jgi:hypothetical protein